MKRVHIVVDSASSVRRLCNNLPGLLEWYHNALQCGAPILYGTCTVDLHVSGGTLPTSYSLSMRAVAPKQTQLKWSTRVYVKGELRTHHFGISSVNSATLPAGLPVAIQWPRRVQCDYVFQLLEQARGTSDPSLGSSILSSLAWVHTLSERSTGECLLLLVHGIDLSAAGLRSVAGTLLSLVGDQAHS